MPGPWPLRAMWAALPVLAGPALGDALATASRPVQVVASAGAWTAWTLVLVATLVPRAVTLTVVRLAAPAPGLAVVVAAVVGPAGLDDAVALAASVAVAAAVVLPTTTDAFVDGSSYGTERRFALRTPPVVLLGPAPVAWVLGVGVPAAAALFLAAGEWVTGGTLAVVGALGVGLGVPALHRLSLRWLVFVPAGLVVHDRLALVDPVLVRRSLLAGLGPATTPQSGDAGDMTLGAGGLALALMLGETADLAVARGLGPRRQAVEVQLDHLVVAPLRPGAVLAEADARRWPVYRAEAEPTTQSPS